MYERFTDRSRKVMQLANQAAQKFNHEYIATEHILVGLIQEGSGVAANVLKNLGADLKAIMSATEKAITPGPEMVSMGKLPTTPRAKKVLEFAMEEAINLNHSYVGTEHLLLGLLREDEGVAAQVLKELGLEITKIRKSTLELLGYEPKPQPMAIIQQAVAEASQNALRTALAPNADGGLVLVRTDKGLISVCVKLESCCPLCGKDKG